MITAGLNTATPVASAGASSYVEDTFTDANGTALESHTPDVDVVGGGWVKVNSSADIQSNQLNAAGGGTIVYTIDTGQSNYVLTITKVAGGNAASVIFRYTDENNKWLARRNGGTLELYRRTSGTWTLMDSTATTPSTGSYTLVITCNGTSITVETQGDTVSATNSDHQTATRIGIDTQSHVGTYDNLTVVPL